MSSCASPFAQRGDSVITLHLATVGAQPSVHSVSNIADEALHWSYPPLQSAPKPPGASLPSSAVARALADVTAVEDNIMDILLPAHTIAVHALKLLQNPL